MAENTEIENTGNPVPSEVLNPTPEEIISSQQQAPTQTGMKRIAPPGNKDVVYIRTQPAGSSGTKVYAGYFSEEYLTNELHGTVAADAYDKMRRGDAKIKMGLAAVKTPIIAADWSIHPADPDNEESVMHAKFIEHVLFKDMDKPFSKTECLSLCDFGFSMFEITHKPVIDHEEFGTYIGLKSLGWRSPRSILYWRLNPEDGSIDHVHQLITGDLQRYVDIPGQFLLVASLEKEGDNYEGISLLRPAYGAWKRKNLDLKLKAIGNERNAVPTPTAEIPDGKQNTVEYQNLIASLENYTSHENSYFTYPAGWKIDFLHSTGWDPEKMRSSIEFENSEMIGAFMANFLLLGSTQSGSRAVSMDQSEFFLGSIQHVADEAVNPFNHKLIPELIKMKFGPQKAYPQLKITGISDKAGLELAQSLKLLAESQWIQPDDDSEVAIRKRYQLPKKSDKGVRVVKAPAAMQEGENIQVDGKLEKPGDEKNVKASELDTYFQKRLGSPNFKIPKKKRHLYQALMERETSKKKAKKT